MGTSLVALPPLTLNSFEQAVGARLDSTHWTAAEIRAFVVEAIRTWNAAARYYRDRIVFQTKPGFPFYDLSSVANSALGYSIKDQDTITEMEYHLLEPPTPTAWSGTEMFTLDQLTSALERRRNQFLGETGSVLTHYFPQISPPPISRIQLQDSVIDIRRAAWLSGGKLTWDQLTKTWDTTGGTWDMLTGAFTYSTLWRDDEFGVSAFLSNPNLTPATPQVYGSTVIPPFQMWLAPAPSDEGILELIVVAAGAALNPGAGVLLGVPDDFAWVVKYGALADLLGKDGPARDPFRAEYCEQRWREGVELARMSTTAMRAEINGVPAQIVTLHDLDAFSAGWQNVNGPPTVIGSAGFNIVAASPVPDGVYSITLDVVRNAPFSGDYDSLNLTRDAADAIIDLAEHIGAFKEGGEEFKATMPHYERLMRLASIHNEKLRANAQNIEILSDRSRMELQQRPIRKSK